MSYHVCFSLSICNCVVFHVLEAPIGLLLPTMLKARNLFSLTAVFFGCVFHFCLVIVCFINFSVVVPIGPCFWYYSATMCSLGTSLRTLVFFQPVFYLISMFRLHTAKCFLRFKYFSCYPYSSVHVSLSFSPYFTMLATIYRVPLYFLIEFLFFCFYVLVRLSVLTCTCCSLFVQGFYK